MDIEIDKYWDFYTNNFDFIILNTYTTQEEYDERVEEVWLEIKYFR